jgi:hypothetical protein
MGDSLPRIAVASVPVAPVPAAFLIAPGSALARVASDRQTAGKKKTLRRRQQELHGFAIEFTLGDTERDEKKQRIQPWSSHLSDKSFNRSASPGAFFLESISHENQAAILP